MAFPSDILAVYSFKAIIQYLSLRSIFLGWVTSKLEVQVLLDCLSTSFDLSARPVCVGTDEKQRIEENTAENAERVVKESGREIDENLFSSEIS